MKLIERIENILFPSKLYCHCCGNFIDENNYYGLCQFCLDAINWNYEIGEEKENYKVTKVMEYGIFERSIIFSLKYKKKKFIAKDVADMIADKLEMANLKGDILVPVPMYKKKERKRGFNQSKLICKYLGKRLNIQVESDILLRIRNTKSMRSLNQIERKENILNSIKLVQKNKDKIKDKIIILVDDFITTGSTALECKKELEKGNPKEIIFVAFAGR